MTDGLPGLLERAHGRRQSRLLSLAQVEACVAEAMVSAWGFAWRQAGEVGDPRALTTVCLAVAQARAVTVGVAIARAQEVTPGRAWPELGHWDRYQPAANVAAAQRWARRQAPDRLVLTPARAAPVDEAAGWLGQILAHPEDDVARRVYADWLQERGEPRGEFIALQLERPPPARAEAVAARELALQVVHRADWLGPLAGAEHRFRRGFLEWIAVGPGQAQHLARLVEREPLRAVRANGAQAALEVAASRWLLGVRELSVGPGGPALDAAGLERVLASPFLKGLRRLGLTSQPLGDAGAEVLARLGPAALPRLSSLHLDQVGLGPPGVRSLSRGDGFQRLATLEVVGSILGPDGLAPLVEGPAAHRLRRLRLDDVRLGDAGARRLARGGRWPALEALSIRNNGIGPGGFDALLASRALPALRWLDVSGNRTGRRLLPALAARFGVGSPGPPEPW